jgi:hypothetical protein
MSAMGTIPSIRSRPARASGLRAAVALLLLVLVACTSAPSASTDFLVLESQKFT